jgi:ectoine hydroxylase-related dioxygenase (phytanoyl-CoA dioxygenase family)
LVVVEAIMPAHQASAAEVVAAMRANGFALCEGVLSAAEIAEIKSALQPYLAAEQRGRNNFEGYLTERIYSLVACGKAFEALAEHPLVLDVCDAFLLPNYLLTASQAININPGETRQAPHTDDAFYRIPRPRAAISISTMWAIDDFTVQNGATEIVSGSHAWADDTLNRVLDSIDFATAPVGERVPQECSVAPEWERQLRPATMSAGSVMIFLGTLLHRGGANRTALPRLAISNQYCEPWARQQENFMLSIPAERTREMSPRLQAMLGYSIYPPFMGHIRGLHPRRLLEG